MKKSSAPRIPAVVVSIQLALLLSLQTVRAGSASWKSNPTSGNWNTAGNWTPATVPNGPSDTATFALSNTTAISLSASVEVNGIVYNPGASPFTISATSSQILTISGLGITNNSGVSQAFSVGTNPAEIIFTNSATAGTQTSFTTAGGVSNLTGGGRVIFFDDSTGAESVFVNNGGTVTGSYGGSVAFTDTANAGNVVITNQGRGTATASGGGTATFSGSATAGNATITNKPNGQPILTVSGGDTEFFDAAIAGNSTITNEGATVSGQIGGGTNFEGNSSANNATIICNGGQIAGAAGGLLHFVEGAKTGNGILIANGGVNGGDGGKIQIDTRTGAGAPTVQLHGNGTLELLGSASGVRMVGALEGDGIVQTNFSGLTVGANDLSSTFTGTIQGSGSLTKIGSGVFTFAGAATYTGGTDVESGTLIVTTAIGSPGLGTVSVGDHSGDGNTTIIGGPGTIGGTLFVGVGDPAEQAILAPAAGSNRPTTLTAQQQVVFSTGSFYNYTFKARGRRARTDLLIANGVILGGTPMINLLGQVQGTLRIGLVLTLINNTSADPISGVFTNLSDGAIVTIGGNNFQADYQGGDGNDLTLTVVQ